MTRRSKVPGKPATGRLARRRARVVLVGMLLLGALAGPARPQNSRGGAPGEFDKQIEQQEKKLQGLRDEIQRLQARDRELGRTERSTAQKLRELERESALRADLLRELENKQTRVTEQLAGIRAEHERAGDILAERKRQLSRTLRAMYVRGAPTSAEIVLRAESLHYALSHFKYLELLARNNERLLREIHEQERYLAATDARLTETLFELQKNAEETRTEKQELAQVRQGRQAVLRRVRVQRAEYQQALADLSEAEKKVQSVIATLEERRRAAEATGSAADVFPDIGFAKMRGSMPWPVHGHVASGFGQHKHPKHGTVTFNSGIDITAPQGAPVRCVARGRVEYVKWLDGYGRTVIINHGGGFYTVYAHLEETLVESGQDVEPGGMIGRVGDSGSLEGAQLHFEVWAKSEPVDPRAWLGR